MTIQDVFDRYYKSESTSLKSWCDDIYSTYFGDCFEYVDDLYNKIRITDDGFTHVKLSDDELEKILTDVPLNLYKASEALNMLRLEHDMIKLKRSEIRRDLEMEINDDPSYVKLSKSDVSSILASKLVDHDLLMHAYDTVIQRADNERSACRELIMSAKKIFDSRRDAEKTNPVSEMDAELPDYKDIQKNQYIK